MSFGIVFIGAFLGLATAQPSTRDLEFSGTVTAIVQRADDWEPWAVTVRVERIISGSFSGSTFTFTVHSPARMMLEVGHSCAIRATWTGKGYSVNESEVRVNEPPCEPQGGDRIHVSKPLSAKDLRQIRHLTSAGDRLLEIDDDALARRAGAEDRTVKVTLWPRCSPATSARGYKLSRHRSVWRVISIFKVKIVE